MGKKITPGSSTKLNAIAGITSILALTDGEEKDANIKAKVLPANVLVKFSNGKVALTDGVKKIEELVPLIDQVLNETEKGALVKTFSGTDGAYKATEGGFLVLGANGRMAAAELPASVWDAQEEKILLDALPDSVRAGVTYVKDITERDGLSADGEEVKDLVFVIDATGDASVKEGSAMYAYTDIDNPEFKSEEAEDPDTNPRKVKGWLKIAEVESLDIDVESLKPNYEHVEEAGAVMYDHSIFVSAPTATALVGLELSGAGQEITQ